LGGLQVGEREADENDGARIMARFVALGRDQPPGEVRGPMGSRPDPERKQEPLSITFYAARCAPDGFAISIKSAEEPLLRADYQMRRGGNSGPAEPARRRLSWATPAVKTSRASGPGTDWERRRPSRSDGLGHGSPPRTEATVPALRVRSW